VKAARAVRVDGHCPLRQYVLCNLLKTRFFYGISKAPQFSGNQGIADAILTFFSHIIADPAISARDRIIIFKRIIAGVKRK
jgi:hypothetical protein